MQLYPNIEQSQTAMDPIPSSPLISELKVARIQGVLLVMISISEKLVKGTLYVNIILLPRTELSFKMINIKLLHKSTYHTCILTYILEY